MREFATQVVDTDVLILGGGMSGCGAAVEAAYWAKPLGLKVTLIDKAAIDRSGPVAMGLSAINTYMGLDGKVTMNPRQPERFVEYVTNDQMGLMRQDMVYDIARHVDSSVKHFDKWGLPIWKDEAGNYVKSGEWQVMIAGESYKVLVAEAAKAAIGALGDKGEILERVVITHLLMDEKEPNRIAGAVGFSNREDKFYVFKSKVTICLLGGAVHVFRPRSQGEGFGRSWMPPFVNGSVYALVLQAGGELTQMDNTFVPPRFKDSYGPVGTFFLLFKTPALNAYGEAYVGGYPEQLKAWDPYASAKPTPTPMRNYEMILCAKEGKTPFLMHTEKVVERYKAEITDPKELKKKIKIYESEAWEDFLDMCVGMANLWACTNCAPEEKGSEIMPTEPYLLGSHSGCCGIWVSGPDEAWVPEDYKVRAANGKVYNRMTTVDGLFTAGDGVGCSGHKFSSGSHAEGRMAAKQMVRYAKDNAAFKPELAMTKEQIVDLVYKPVRIYLQHCAYTTADDINPNYMKPNGMMYRMMKATHEYGAGTSTFYQTSSKNLEIVMEMLAWMREDCEKLAAGDLHELMRCWEIIHRIWTVESHLRHIQFRKETRYPGFYYQADHPGQDDANWFCFVNSKYDPKAAKWDVFKKDYIKLIP